MNTGASRRIHARARPSTLGYAIVATLLVGTCPVYTNAAAQDQDPWKLPFRGFRDPSEGKGPASTETGGLGIPSTAAAPRGRRDIHTLVLTECANYQDWQTIVAAFAWRESGQPGNITRVVNCPPDRTDSYKRLMMEVMPTFWAREYLYNAKIKDTYAAYNKPGAVVDFLAKAPAEERFVIVLDSDMLLHKPFLPEEFDIKPGWAVGSSGYNYLRGVVNDLSMRHASNIPPRNDTLAGPVGRRGDQVGGPYFMLMDDLRRVAPLWLSATEEMRQDHEAWKDSGDKAPPGQPVWISEMYGYSFGAARAGVWHRGAPDFMLYPSFPPSRVPHVIHYGLNFHLNDDAWEFDKHSYLGFDPLKCPPWPSWDGYHASRLRGLVGEALDNARLSPPPKPTIANPTEGIFPPPPHPDRLHKLNPKKGFLEKYRDLIAIFTVAQSNAALCEFHSWTCPWSAQLEAVCGDAWELYLDIREAVDAIEFVWDCTDHNSECSWWAKSGECVKMADYMRDHCAVSCNHCTPRPSSDFVPRERRPLRFAKRSRAAESAVSDQGALGRRGMDVPATDNRPIDERQEHQGVQQPKTLQDNSATALPSRLSFASLVQRCATAFDPPLDHASLGLCVRSAGLGLAYVQNEPARGKLLEADVATHRKLIDLEQQGSGSFLGRIMVFTGAFSGTMLVAWWFERRQSGWARMHLNKYTRLFKRAYGRKE